MTFHFCPSNFSSIWQKFDMKKSFPIIHSNLFMFTWKCFLSNQILNFHWDYQNHLPKFNKWPYSLLDWRWEKKYFHLCAKIVSISFFCQRFFHWQVRSFHGNTFSLHFSLFTEKFLLQWPMKKKSFLSTSLLMFTKRIFISIGDCQKRRGNDLLDFHFVRFTDNRFLMIVQLLQRILCAFLVHHLFDASL